MNDLPPTPGTHIDLQSFARGPLASRGDTGTSSASSRARAPIATGLEMSKPPPHRCFPSTSTSAAPACSRPLIALIQPPHALLAAKSAVSLCGQVSQRPANLHKMDMVRTTSPNRMCLPARLECAFIVACSGRGRMFQFGVRAPQVADSCIIAGTRPRARQRPKTRAGGFQLSARARTVHLG